MPVISVENLSKSYRLGQINTGTFSRDLEAWWARLRGQPNPHLRIGETDHGNRDGEELWALKDVSFTVEQGEVLGIIGRNGAGKSTLLKILSRVTAPTSGRIRVKGRVASLLEVGTGFHPELTGRENVYLNGAILGMTRQEVTRKFDEIVDFAGVEKFIDTPVKRYSSGMYVRLAFAVAAHLDPEILVVDEVLAVGDAEFQKKCLGKMGEVAKEGRTVFFVSHNMAAITSLCTRALLFEKGSIILNDFTDKVVGQYLRFTGDDDNGTSVNLLEAKKEGNGDINFLEWWIHDDVLGKGRKARSCQPCTFKVAYQVQLATESHNVDFVITIKDVFGRPVFTSSTDLINSSFSCVPSNGVFSCKFNEFPLAPGTYILHLYCERGGDLSQRIPNAGSFDVMVDDVYGTGKLPKNKHGVIVVRNYDVTIDEDLNIDLLKNHE